MRWLAIFLLYFFATPALAQRPDAPCIAKISAVFASKAAADGRQPAESAWEAVDLPDNWQRRHPEFEGGSVWYRIHWRYECFDKTTPQRVALLLPSIVLAGEVFINGQLLYSDEHLSEPLSRSWNTPHQWTLPEAWLQDGDNLLEVRVVGPGGGQSVGLGPIVLGDPKVIDHQFADIQWNNRTLFEINIIVSAVIGILFFCIWAVRPDQTFYGWYALSSLFWVAFIANILVTSPWPFANSLTMARANMMALLLSIVCFCLFTWSFGGLVRPRLTRALWIVTGFFLFATAFTPEAWIGQVLRVSFLIATFIFLSNIVLFIIHAFRTREKEHAILAASLLVLPILSVSDILVLFGLYQAKPTFPYTNIALTLALSAIVGLRHARNLKCIKRYNEDLAQSVDHARSVLAKALEQDHARALVNTRLQDRLQIAHDLHDGLGGALVHMIASVQQGADSLPKQQVLSMLKFIRDDLRQTIDSNNSASVTVPATPQEWIAPLRHRFTGIFDELGVDTDWQFPQSWRTPPSALQYLALTRLVEEALTNVIKHSRAQRVKIHLDQTDPDQLVLEIEDDGVGFDVEAVRLANIGIGMRSMSVRIGRVGGTIDVLSRPGRTILTARLALTKP
ncbi:sensor histidine kinase [Brucella inopinata]|uniref:sensor histidine kinase n=1 Tax=Brucella inopinata TaxID=1218315 RepID=UPI0008DA672F|nr:ATP-binding protein [Brucella inopinata]